MYTEEDVECICLSCVNDGSAAVKFPENLLQLRIKSVTWLRKNNCFKELRDIYQFRVFIGWLVAMIIVNFYDMWMTVMTLTN